MYEYTTTSSSMLIQLGKGSPWNVKLVEGKKDELSRAKADGPVAMTGWDAQDESITEQQAQHRLWH